nr:fertilization-influencing membrane protein isoform X1 [Dasypus novemcinctus]
MRLWQWAWLWLAGLGAVETAPSPGRAEISAPGSESWLFLEAPDFFDYPDSDQARILALSEFIGEEPITFVDSGAAGKGPKETCPRPLSSPMQPPPLPTNKSPACCFLTGLSGASRGHLPFLGVSQSPPGGQLLIPPKNCGSRRPGWCSRRWSLLASVKRPPGGPPNPDGRKP